MVYLNCLRKLYLDGVPILKVGGGDGDGDDVMLGK